MRWIIGMSSAILLVSCGPEQSYGEQLYQAQCASCHLSDGSGLRGLYPPLYQTDYLQEHFADLPCIIEQGMEGPILVNGREYDQPMPAIVGFTDADIANLMNYLDDAMLDGKRQFVTPDQVIELRQGCKDSYE